jgi:hypothetical protein
VLFDVEIEMVELTLAVEGFEMMELVLIAVTVAVAISRNDGYNVSCCCSIRNDGISVNFCCRCRRKSADESQNVSSVHVIPTYVGCVRHGAGPVRQKGGL